MYNVPYFKERDQEEILNFIRKNSFATVVGCLHSLPVATQVPLLIEERNGKLFLQGHIMRKTDHHKAFKENQHVLCLFTGAHSYVSASWYTTPQSASTWNYITVQARGTLRFLDQTSLRDILQKTTTLYEGGNNTAASFDKLSDEYITSNMKAIEGFEIEVTDLQNTFKLSQNRDKASYKNIIHELERKGGAATDIALEMKNREEKLFDAQDE